MTKWRNVQAHVVGIDACIYNLRTIIFIESFYNSFGGFYESDSS